MQAITSSINKKSVPPPIVNEIVEQIIDETMASVAEREHSTDAILTLNNQGLHLALQLLNQKTDERPRGSSTADIALNMQLSLEDAAILVQRNWRKRQAIKHVKVKKHWNLLRNTAKPAMQKHLRNLRHAYNATGLVDSTDWADVDESSKVHQIKLEKQKQINMAFRPNHKVWKGELKHRI